MSVVQVLTRMWRSLRRLSRPETLSLSLLLLVLVATSAVFALSGTAQSFGLTVEVRTAPDDPGPVHVAPEISTTVLDNALANAAPGPHWVIWRGAMHVPATGISGFRLSTSGTALLFIDQQMAAKATGGSEVSRSVRLAPGPHELTLIYSQQEDISAIRLLWIDPTGRTEEIPSRAFAPSQIPRAAWHLREHHRRVGTVLAALWAVALGLALAVFCGPRALTLWELEAVPPLGPLRAVLAFALLLGAYPLWWGIATGGYWAMDEIGPAAVSDGVARAYSGGWHEKYPPFHYYLVTLLLAPFFGAERAGLVPILDGAAYGTEMLLVRGLSLVLGLATVALVHVCGTAAFGRRAGLVAALTWSTVLPFVYHTKLGTLDVPYTFWFALSLLSYIRIVQRGALRDYLLFATTAVLAVCTKDQAYGLYGLPAVHVAVLTVRRRMASEGVQVWQAVADRRLLFATAWGMVLFALVHNFAFNLEGFRRHVEVITGGASEAYRYFENTPSGHWGLARDVADQLLFSFSWPATVAALAGIVLPFRRHSAGSRQLWLLLPALSYYLTFLAVVGYCYDRFLLPVCLVLSLYAGRAAARLLEARQRDWRAIAAVGMCLVYMSMRAASVNMLMAADSRVESTRWIRDHVPSGASIGFTAPFEYLPTVSHPSVVQLRPSVEESERLKPDYVLVNSQFARRWEPDTGEARWFAALARGELPYRLVHRVKEPVSWAILTWERQFDETSVVGYSSVNKLNPEILIYQRVDNSTGSRPSAPPIASRE